MTKHLDMENERLKMIGFVLVLGYGNKTSTVINADAVNRFKLTLSKST